MTYTEQRREYFRARYVANRDAILAKQREYQAANPEVVKRAQRKYKATHADQLRENRRQHRLLHPEQGKRQHAAWVAAHKDERGAYMRNWREEKREHRKAYDAAYRLANPQQRAETQNRRRARQIGNGGSHTKAQWEGLKTAFHHACGYCKATEVRLTKDHDVPLSRGGTDDIKNIVPACLPCNRRKHAKTGAEFVSLLEKERCSRKE